MSNVNFGKLTSMHFYAWKKGLKTGMYYLRTKPATDAIKFTVDQQALEEKRTEEVDSHPPQPAPSVFTPPKRPDILAFARVSIGSSKEFEELKMKRKNDPEVVVAPTGGGKSEADSAQEVEAWRDERQKQQEAMMCSLDNKEACLSCGS